MAFKGKLRDIQERYFAPHAFMEIGNIEGSRPSDDYERFIIGHRCGPTKIDTEMVCHEMSHLVEINEERLGEAQWGLVLPAPLYIPGMRYTGYHDFVTPAHVLRECRVWAFEHCFRKEFGIGNTDIRKMSSSYEFLTSIYSIPAEGNKGRHDWVCTEIEKALEWINFDLFEKRWVERMPKMAAALDRKKVSLLTEEAA